MFSSRLKNILSGNARTYWITQHRDVVVYNKVNGQYSRFSLSLTEREEGERVSAMRRFPEACCGLASYT